MVRIVRFAERKSVFDPEELAVLANAYDEAWARLSASGSECVRPAYARAMREVVARRVVDAARRGLTGAEQIAAEAVHFLAVNYRYETRSRRENSSAA